MHEQKQHHRNNTVNARAAASAAFRISYIIIRITFCVVVIVFMCVGL